MKTKASRAKNFNTRLAAYSATAGAALLAAPAADATIQNITTFSYDGGSSFTTTPPHPSGATNHYYTAATDGHNAGFIGLFRIHNYHSGYRVGGRASIAGNMAGSHSGRASNLALSAPIIDRNFQPGTLAFRAYSNNTHTISHTPSSEGNFLPVGANNAATGYVGFRTDLRSQTYYGWLRVKVTNDGNGNPFEISLVSKNGDPDVFGAFGLKSDNITAGEMALPVPEPSVAAIGGLGLLALGVAGVREMRRRKKAGAEVTRLQSHR